MKTLDAILGLPAKTLAAVGQASGRTLGVAGSLLGNVVGGFLAGVQWARTSVGGTYHDAARRDATTADWRARLRSADQTLLGELDTMLARSRQAVANDGWAASAQGGYARHVVGGGITARTAAKHPTTGEQLESFNAQVDRLWEERVWTPRLIDAEEVKTGPEKQRLWMNELFAAGGVFVLADYLPEPGATRLLQQEIEYEQRDEVTTQFDGRAVRGGVEVGDRGQPLAYHLFTAGHPLETFATKPQRFEAGRVDHVFRQDRVLQRVGAPWMRPVLARLRQLAMYEQYTMLQARGRAANVGFIKQQPGSGPAQIPSVVARQLGTAPAAGGENAEQLEVQIAPGVWTVLKPGQEPFLPNPATPDSMYPPFVLEHLKGISAGTGLDFTTVCRWYADGNFSSQRQAKLDLMAEIDFIGDVLFVHKICRRDRQRWLDLIVGEGRVSASGYRESDAWRAAYATVNWQGPPRLSIDEIKDEAAWDLRIKAGRASPQEYCNAHGKTIEQVLSEIKEFRDLAARHRCGDLVDRWLGTFVAATPKAGMAPDDPTIPRDAPPDAGDLSQLIVRQHVLQGLLDNGDNGPNGNGRHR
ncbi:MAG TPA: phage portal protein [Phycisphaerae bacterium]|nr:phage portal protein [Phycisphaerae bacterium]